MSAIEVDTTRLPLLMHDLRLPAPNAPTRRDGQRRASSRRSPSWRLPNAAAGGPSATLPRHVC
jgi:hypothetical protein